MMDKLSKHSLPTVADINLNIDLDTLRQATDRLNNQFREPPELLLLSE